MTAPAQQKLKIKGPVVVTANRLGDGAVVYRAAVGGWTTRLDAAAVVTTAPDASDLLAAANADGIGAVDALCGAGRAARRAHRAGQPARTHPPRRTDIRSAGELRHLSKGRACTATTNSTTRWLPNGSPNSAIRSRAGSRGELTEDEFKPLRLMNGVYLQLHAYMLRIAIPYGTLSSAQLRKLAHIARRYDRSYGHFTTRQNLQFNWIKLDESARRAGRARRGRLARHADQRQLRAQHHHRPVGGRRRRRDRGSAPLGGDPAPAFDHASGILVPAAQVQDRHHRRQARPRRRARARYRPMPAQERRRRDRLRGDRRRRARPHAVHRQDHQAVSAQARSAQLCRGDLARLQPIRPARQYLQGAHQDPGARARRREIRDRRSRPNGRRSRMARWRIDPALVEQNRGALPLSGLRAARR